MRVLLATREMGWVELFHVVTQHSVTVLFDLRAGGAKPIPPILQPIYHRPVKGHAEKFLTRFAQQWSCGTGCTRYPAEPCTCEHTILVLVEAERSRAVREMFLRMNLQARILDLEECSCCGSF